MEKLIVKAGSLESRHRLSGVIYSSVISPQVLGLLGMVSLL
jgi:hypothetical protein